MKFYLEKLKEVPRQWKKFNGKAIIEDFPDPSMGVLQ